MPGFIESATWRVTDFLSACKRNRIRYRQARRAELMKREALAPICIHCGGILNKTKAPPSLPVQGFGCLVVLVGVFLSLTLFGVLLGLPIVVMGVCVMAMYTKVLKCRRCGAIVPRG